MSALFFSCFTYKASAQVSININIGDQPDWGPYGYDRVQYYYLPDIDVYYDVMGRTYTYFDGRYWITSTYLPHAYRHYDLYRGYKVVLNYSSPWLRSSYNRNYYARYRNHYDQRNIRDYRRGSAYSQSNRSNSSYNRNNNNSRSDNRQSPANRNYNQRNSSNNGNNSARERENPANNNNSRGRETTGRQESPRTQQTPRTRSESPRQESGRTQVSPRTQSNPGTRGNSSSQGSSGSQQRSRPSRGV